MSIKVLVLDRHQVPPRRHGYKQGLLATFSALCSLKAHQLRVSCGFVSDLYQHRHEAWPWYPFLDGAVQRGPRHRCTYRGLFGKGKENCIVRLLMKNVLRGRRFDGSSTASTHRCWKRLTQCISLQANPCSNEEWSMSRIAAMIGRISRAQLARS